MPAAARSCSSMMCPSEAWPEVAQRIAPGRALASASSPAKSRAALAGVAISSTGEYMTLAIGWMSLRAS